MNALAERYADRDVGSVFLYTNEAHPAEHYPHLTSMDQKLQHALALRDVYGVERPIVADALDGAAHRAYGTMPNMSWIFTKGGVPAYKSDWTDARSIANALDYILDVGRRRKGGGKLAPFKVVRLDYRDADREAFLRGLERNGPKAAVEFRAFTGD